MMGLRNHCVPPINKMQVPLTFDPFGPLVPGSPVFPCMKEATEDGQEKNVRERNE